MVAMKFTALSVMATDEVDKGRIVTHWMEPPEGIGLLCCHSH